MKNTLAVPTQWAAWPCRCHARPPGARRPERSPRPFWPPPCRRPPQPRGPWACCPAPGRLPGLPPRLCRPRPCPPRSARRTWRWWPVCPSVVGAGVYTSPGACARLCRPFIRRSRCSCLVCPSDFGSRFGASPFPKCAPGCAIRPDVPRRKCRAVPIVPAVEHLLGWNIPESNS